MQDRIRSRQGTIAELTTKEFDGKGAKRSGKVARAQGWVPDPSLSGPDLKDVGFSNRRNLHCPVAHIKHREHVRPHPHLQGSWPAPQVVPPHTPFAIHLYGPAN